MSSERIAPPAETPAVVHHKERRKALAAAGRWPESHVTRTGVSPMNPRVKWAELTCGHTVFRNRRPSVGATIVCEKCAEKAHV